MGTNEENKQMIPKKIHQIYLQGFDSLDPDYVELIIKMKDINPEWTYKIYSEKDIMLYIKENFDSNILDSYKKINPIYPAARADFFRYLILYNEGGFYIDVKSFPSKPLDSIISNEDKFIVCQWDREKYPTYGLHKEIDYVENGEYQQWNIMCEKKSPIMKDVINGVVYNINNYSIFKQGVARKGVLRTTGPIVFTEKVYEYRRDEGVKIFSSNMEPGIVYSMKNHLLANHYSNINLPVIKGNIFEEIISRLLISPLKKIKNLFH